MASDKTPQAKLHPAVNEALANLQAALPSQGLPTEVTLKDIASALVLYTPPQQAAGMLAAYWRHIDRLPRDGDATDDAGSA